MRGGNQFICLVIGPWGRSHAVKQLLCLLSLVFQLPSSSLLFSSLSALSRLQEEIHQKEEAENNLSAFRAVRLLFPQITPFYLILQSFYPESPKSKLKCSILAQLSLLSLSSNHFLPLNFLFSLHLFYLFLLVVTIILFSVSASVSRMLTMPLWPGWTWRDALRACRRRLPSSRRSMKRCVDLCVNSVCLPATRPPRLQYVYALCMSVGWCVLYHITTLCEVIL